MSLGGRRSRPSPRGPSVRPCSGSRWRRGRTVGGGGLARHQRRMAFNGWPIEAVEFYEGLEADPTKSYWQANKAVYEQCVRTPMEALLDELADEFGRGKIFRPYRDVRFSRD